MAIPETPDVSLRSLVKEKYIQLNLKQRNKTKIIAELVNLIVRPTNTKDRRAFFNAIVGREKLGSTAIGNGVAIPHTKIDKIKRPILAFGRSAEGVDFNSLDGEKTYIFFMLISSKKDVGRHLKILAKISHLMKDKFAVECFKKAQSKKEILSLLSYFEKGAR